jgi:predicted ribosome quality control (RQC) complex YloA/Tae2 family protein
MPVVDEAGFLKGEIGNLDTLLARLEAKKQQLREKENNFLIAGDTLTANLSRRQEALLKMDAEFFQAGMLPLMNPSGANMRGRNG